MPVKAIKHNLRQKDILPQFARSSLLRMKLAEVRHGFAVHDSARGTTGMEVSGDDGVEVKRRVLERRQQFFDIALQVEERVRPCRQMHRLRGGVAGCGETEVTPLV